MIKYTKGIRAGVVMLQGPASCAALAVAISLCVLGAAAQSVTVSSESLGTSTIIKFENAGGADITEFRLWLSADDSFKSFKAGNVWTGTKSAEGLLTFTSSLPVSSGQSVSFGIRTNTVEPGINWEAVGTDGAVIGTGKAFPEEDPPPIVIEPPKAEPPGVLASSSFRLIPEKINAGSTIRVVGEQFGAGKSLDFAMNGQRLGSVTPGESGRFVLTASIPDGSGAGTASFSVKDALGNEKKLELGLRAKPDAPPVTAPPGLVVEGFPEQIRIGGTVSLHGTGDPGGFLTASITAPDGQIISADLAKIGDDGKWEHHAIIPQNALFGTYSALITDGKDSETRTWIIESSTILLEPGKIKYEVGDTIKFGGIAEPGVPLALILENPQQEEVYSDLITVGEDGMVNIEVATDSIYMEGTYILFATQGESAVTFLVGLGEFPQQRLIVKTDKQNYDTRDTIRLTISGPASSIFSLTIVKAQDSKIPIIEKDGVISLDDGGKTITIPLSLGTGGHSEYEISLSGLKSDVYTVVVAKGNMEIRKVFTLGLNPTSNPVNLQVTKSSYLPGESILVLGSSDRNSLITLLLADPSGDVIRTKETFTDHAGSISDTSFRIPSDGERGQWKIIAKSGGKSSSVKVEVVSEIDKGISITIPKNDDLGGGDSVTISGAGATPGGHASIIIYVDDEILEEQNIRVTQKGEFELVWIIPSVMGPGTYSVNATDSDGHHTTAEIRLR